MEITAIAKYTRISPRKIRGLTKEIKKLKIADALNVLEYSSKRGAQYIKEVIQSALANAKNNLKIEKDNLFIKKIDVSEGPVFKRQRAVSRGMGHPYKRRTSHIRVVLEQIKERNNGS